jgi:hypothetical protein
VLQNPEYLSGIRGASLEIEHDPGTLEDVFSSGEDFLQSLSQFFTGKMLGNDEP